MSSRLGVRVPGSASTGQGHHGPHGLTQRELDVVKLVREGYTNQQIAGSLFVSVHTVETHLSHAYAKLGVSLADRPAQGARRGCDRAGHPLPLTRSFPGGV